MSHPENQGPMPNMPEGFPFTKDSAIRELTEPTTAMLYPHIAAMTAVRDEVGAAVDKHSTFREDPFGRLSHTMLAAGQLVFGNQEEASATAKRIYEYHKTVKGNHRGVEYNANSIDMQVWVLGCVFTGINEAKRRWVKPLEPDHRQALYSDIRTFGLFFGIPEKSMTRDVREFDEYWHDTIENHSLNTEVSREVARTVLLADTDAVPKWMQKINRAVSITSLDERIQDKLELFPTDKDKQIAARVDKTLWGLNKIIPVQARRKITPVVMNTKRMVSKNPKTTAGPKHPGIRIT